MGVTCSPWSHFNRRMEGQKCCEALAAITVHPLAFPGIEIKDVSLDITPAWHVPQMRRVGGSGCPSFTPAEVQIAALCPTTRLEASLRRTLHDGSSLHTQRVSTGTTATFEGCCLRKGQSITADLILHLIGLLIWLWMILRQWPSGAAFSWWTDESMSDYWNEDSSGNQCCWSVPHLRSHF